MVSRPAVTAARMLIVGVLPIAVAALYAGAGTAVATTTPLVLRSGVASPAPVTFDRAIPSTVTGGEAAPAIVDTPAAGDYLPAGVTSPVEPVAAGAVPVDIATDPQARDHDPIHNGAAVGAGIGAIVGAITAVPAAITIIGIPLALGAVAANAAFGAAIGALVGALAPDSVPQVLS